MSSIQVNEIASFFVQLRGAPSLVSEREFLDRIQAFFINVNQKPLDINPRPSFSELSQEIIFQLLKYLDDHISPIGQNQLALFIGYFKKESLLASEECLQCLSELGKSEKYSPGLLARGVKMAQKFVKTGGGSNKFIIKCLEFPMDPKLIGKIYWNKMIDDEWEFFICSMDYERRNAFKLPFDGIYVVIKCMNSEITILQDPVRDISDLCYIECVREEVEEGSIISIGNYAFHIEKMRLQLINIVCYNTETNEKLVVLQLTSTAYIGNEDIQGLSLIGLHQKQFLVYCNESKWYFVNNRPDIKMYKALHNKFSMNERPSTPKIIDVGSVLIIRNIKLDMKIIDSI
jgi:hypothetical protein